MTIRAVLRMGDARLWKTAEPVSHYLSDQGRGDALRSLLQDMRDTMQATGGVGIAAPQIGVGLRVVIFGVPQADPQTGQTQADTAQAEPKSANPRYPDADAVPETVLINPVITPLHDKMEDGWEGCLSLPGLRGLVPRFLHIRYQGYDEYGALIDRTVSGFHARVVQHECDHLDGILYPMRIRDMTQFGYAAELFPDKNFPDE